LVFVLYTGRMSLNLFNSATRQKEVFTPINPNSLSMYVCGITPNNATHLGHAFTYVSFDILFRYLKYKGYDVKYLQNVTDINDGDDVIKQAKEAGTTWEKIADHWTAYFLENMKILHVLPPTYYVKATSSMEKIIEMIKHLVEKEFAYENKGTVYFDVKSFLNYGSLCRFNEKQLLMISRERGNNPDDPHKKNPLDFVLWVKAQGEPVWDSPWGRGRPGWHIECSAMINEYLGDQIDIHGGGRDLVFPHHESEIAQSENYTGKKPYVNYWMHTGMVLYEGEKMSKSLGNLVLVEDLLKKYSANAIRWLMLSHHYRYPWEYVEHDLDDAQKEVDMVQKALVAATGDSKKTIDLKEFTCCLDDDLNTPELLRTILRSAESILVEKDTKKKEQYQFKIRKIYTLLGFGL